jgi:hypothetical protein
MPKVSISLATDVAQKLRSMYKGKTLGEIVKEIVLQHVENVEKTERVPIHITIEKLYITIKYSTKKKKRSTKKKQQEPSITYI